MKSLILILLTVCFINSQAKEHETKKFDCLMSTQDHSKVIEIKSSDINWQEHFDSLDEFEAALEEFVDNYKLKDFNSDEHSFSQRFQQASLVIEATASIKETLNPDENERLENLFVDFETQTSLTISAIYKNNYNKKLKAGDNIDIYLHSGLLFDKKLGMPIFKLRDEYEKYSKIRRLNYANESKVAIGGFSENLESLYANAYEANISTPITVSSIGVYWNNICGEDYLIDKKQYLFFITLNEHEKNKDKQLSLGYFFSVFNTKHKNLIEILVEHNKSLE